MWTNISGFPKLIVSRMVSVFLPVDVFTFEKVFVQVGKWSLAQPEIISVWSIVLHVSSWILFQWNWSLYTKIVNEIDVMWHQKCTIVDHVVPLDRKSVV